MSVDTTPSPPDSLPAFAMPPGACDAHCHIVGPRARFPFAAARDGQTAPDATKEMLRAMHARLGVTRAVIVQSGLHGTDPAATLDAVASSGGAWRGVILAEPTIADATLARLDAAGIRGIRHNLVHQESGRWDEAGLRHLAARAAGLGWHFLLHLKAGQLLAQGDFLRRLPIPLVIDHLARLDPRLGPEQPAMHALRALIDSGTVWVKIAAIDKLSRAPYPHRDMAALAAVLLRAAPERIIWGTDWPHPDGRGLRGGAMPDDARLAALIPLFAEDEASRQKLLVDNPAALYGFA
jgi:predicted TIM-barrel fold metal-dependent hydrolase